LPRATTHSSKASPRSDRNWQVRQRISSFAEQCVILSPQAMNLVGEGV
jgi:hypothetical protein